MSISSRFLRWLLIAELTILFALVFQLNVFGSIDSEWFRSHQANSEALVLSGIYHKKATGSSDIPLGFYNYGEGDWVTRVFDHFQADTFAGLTYGEYTSQYGLQGRLFSALYRALHTTSRQLLEAFNSVLSGLLFALLVDWVRRQYGQREATILAISIVASPWLIAISRNLYWVSWTWFLPMMANGALLLRENTAQPRWPLVYAATAITIWIKALCGYEYITTITIMACIPLVLYYIEESKPFLQSLRRLVITGAAAVFGFGVALLMHASARAPNLLDGLRLIKQDAVRRTAGLAGDTSVLLSRMDVLKRYIFDWEKPSTAFINIPMWVILLFATVSVVALTLNRKRDRRGYALGMAYIFSLLGPLSWFVLAKQHSANHTHLNYVLWYMPTFFLACLCITRRWSLHTANPALDLPRHHQTPLHT